MTTRFDLTQAELDFIYHFRRESNSGTGGPAHQWLLTQGITPSTMIPLLYHDQEKNSRWLDRRSAQMGSDEDIGKLE